MVDFTRLTQHAVSLRRWILISAILFSVAVSNGDTQLQSKSFTGQQATTNRRNSFNFRTFGNVSSLEHCVDFCCRDETCELAIFSRGFHCFGVSCSEPKLCHKILDRLLMEDERELQRSSTITGTKDFIRHTSQITNPRCPQRFVPSFHVLLLGTSTPRAFHKLHVQSIDASQCSAQCFRSRGCFLSFIEDNECYGVTGHDAGANGTKRVQEPSIGLEVAIIDRNKEVSRSLDDDDEDPDELGSDDVDNGVPASKQEVASLQSQSKLQQTVNELPATKMQKKRQTSRNSKVSFASTNSTNGRNNDKFTKKKHTSRLTKEAKIRSVSLAHLSTKSNVLYPNVIHLKLSNEKGITRQNITLPPTKNIFSHLTTKDIALSPNLTVKHASENSGVVPEGSNRVRSTKNLFSEEMKEGRSEDYDSSTNRNEEDFSGDDELSGGGDSSGDRHPSGAVKDSSRSEEDVSGEDEGWGGADNDLNSGSKDISRYSDLSGDSALSGDKHTSEPIKDSSKNDKDVSGEDEGWSEGDDDLSGGRKNISGDDDDDDDVSGDEDLSGDRNTSGVVKDLSKSDNDVSGEGEDWGEANNDLSGDGKDKSGNDEHFSGDFHNTERTSYNEIQHKKFAWKDKALRNTTKTVNADYPGSGDKENGKRKGDHHLIQKKTFVSKKIEKGKEIDLKGLDDLGSDNDDSEKKSRKVVNFPQKTSDSQAAKNGKKTVTERVKYKKGGNSRKESYHVEDPDDLGSDDGYNERTSKKAANLIKKSSISKATKKEKKSDNNNLKSKKKGDTRKEVHLVKDLGDVGSDVSDSDRTSKTVGSLHPKTNISNTIKTGIKADNKHLKFKNESNTIGRIDLVKDPDDLGSDDDDDDDSKRTSKTVGNLHPKTNISNTIMTEKKEDNKHLKSNKVVNTRKKIDLVENLEDLASDNDENVKNKLRKNSKVAPRKDVRLPQKINSKKSTFSNTIKNGKKKDNGYRKPNREGKTKQIDLVEDLNYLGSNDDDSVKTKREQRISRKNASLTPRTNNVTENNNSKVYNEQLKSSSGKTHSKPRDRNTKKAFSNSVKVIGRPLDSANKLPSVSTIKSWTNHSGFKNHFVNHKATPLVTTLVRDSANLQHESGPITEHGIKKGETKQHIARNGERTTKHEDTLKQATVRNSTSTKEKYTQQSGMKESIRPSLNITDAVNKSTESDQSNRIGHHSQTISRKPKKTAKVPPSSDKAKVTSNTRPHNALLKNKASVTRNSKAMTQETQRRSNTSVKGHFTGTKHLKSTPEASTKKSIFKDKNIKNKLTKLMKSSKVQGNDSLQTKETPEKRKTKSSTSPSRFAGIDDLMKYAHRKNSEKRQPFLNHQVERFVPATKQATSGKTTPQRQSHKKTATTRNETMQGQRPMTVRPTASTIFDSLKKDKAMPKKRPNIHRLPSSGKLAIKNLQKLTSSVSGLGTRDQASSKDNRSFPFLPTLSPNVHPKIKEKNPSVRDQGTSKKTHLLLKQRSNEHAFGKKKEFLSHFHKDVNGSDGVDFSVKSNGNRHKEKHSKQDLSLDLEDLGDADFDIMMSNDIPHKDLPKKEKGKERNHKHTDNTKEKQRDTKSDSIGKKKNKNKNDKKKKGGKEDGEESQQNTETHRTSHRHKEKMSDVSGRKHHHHHHKESDHGTDNDDDEAHASNDAGKSSNYDKKSHHRSKHGKSSDPGDKDSESRYRRKKHRHQAKTIDNNGNDDDNNSVESDNEKRRFHKHKEKNQHKAKNNDESVDDEKMQHHYHHSHKTHKKKYDNNDWVGKIIPGKVKLTYEDDDDKKRHHHGQHKVRDDKKTNHKRKHSLVADENPEDISKETEGRKSHRHSHDKHYVEGDDYNKHEKHATHHKNVEDDSEINRNAKHRDNEMKKDNEEKQEHAEKKTDVNYEAIKVGRHRFAHHEDEESHHHEEEDKDNHQHDDDSDDDDDDGDNSSERKNHDKDDDRDESEKSDDDNDEDAKGNSGGNDKKEDYPSKETKKNRVVLGEDSENDDKDEEKDSEESERGHHGNEHENERNNDEREDDQYHDEHHKQTLHNRRKHYRHWKSKHGHHESDYQSKEADSDSDHHNEGDGQVDKRKRNFRKSFIYHKKKAEEQRSRDHYDTERDEEEQLDHDVNSEYKNENHDREFNVDRHHPHPSRHHRHHHLRPLIEKQRKENYEDLYEPDDVKYHHERQHDEQVNFRRHHHLEEHRPKESKNNYRNFQREKEGRHDVYISREDDERRWKFNQEQHDGDFDETSHQRDDQDSYVHRFIGEDKPSDYYHQEDNKRRKFKPWHRRWKNRHYHHNNEEQDYEDSGGLFDSSSWIPNEGYDDNDFYGGEGNHERKKHRNKHRKYKNRKDRQSYEYWAYGNQNPYYYDYKYHKYRSRYENYPPQPSPRYDWHNRYRGGYGQWKPKPKHWYADSQQWDMAGSWRHHPKLRQFHEYRPTGYRWNKFYDNNDDDQFSNQPKPTLYPTVPFLRPTNPRWQRPDATQKGFRGDNLPPAQNKAPSKHYQDWSENGQGVATYGPQQHSPSGFQPQPNPDTVKPGDQPQPVGVQSKYVPPASQQEPDRIDNKTRFHPTVRRQYSATPPAKVLSPPSSIAHIKNIMDSLNAPFSSTDGQHPGSVPSNVQNETNIKNGLNISSSEQNQDSKRLNGFFKEESAGKKSNILRPMNSSKEQPTNNASGNAPHHAQQIPLKTTSNPANVPPQPTHVTNKTTVVHTFQIHTTRNQTTRKPSQTAQNSSTTAVPTHKSTAELTSPAPNFGDVSQSDESSETGKKHRKHRAPVCLAGKTTDDVTLLRGKKAGNFTNVGDVGDFGMCIKRCCQKQKCDLAFKSAETCFLVSCFSQESCQTSPTLDDIFSPRMCFVKRHLRDNDKDLPGKDDDDDDDDDGWNDKVSPSGIHEVCEAERALGILWKKTVAGHYSTHPCPRDAKGLVKRRCEADSRWLPPNFSDCVSSDYQVLYDKSKKLASGADPSPLIRELSQLTTQNIDNSLIFGGDLDRATDIMAAIVQHNGQTDFLEMTREDVENFVRASSNLLDMTNQQEWFNIQKNKPGTADVLRSMEMFALQAAMRLPREDMTEPTITNNIIIKLDRKSAGEGGLTFPDFSNPRVDRWDARHDVIALPSSVFDRVSGEDSTASISFKSLPYLLPDSNVSSGLGPNSKVISTVMHPHPQGKITPPVTVVLSHIKRRRGNPKCVFWDYTLNPHRGGAWSSRGCWLAFNNQSHSICQCSHLSNFAVLMDLSSDESLQKEQKRERTMALMWIGIPVLIVGVIGGLYMSFSWNRKSGIPSTVTRPSSSLNEKTGLLGQRVVTSQVREEFPPSPTRDLYRALSPGYSPTGDLEWQDEFDFDVETGDQRFKQMLLPKLQLLQNQLINEFYDADKMETKKMLLQSKSEENTQMEINTQVHCETLDRQTIQMKPTKIQREPAQKRNRQTRTSSGKNLRVRFADERPPGRNLTDEDKERFKRLQRMERRVFAQHLSRWKASSHLNLSE